LTFRDPCLSEIEKKNTNSKDKNDIVVLSIYDPFFIFKKVMLVAFFKIYYPKRSYVIYTRISLKKVINYR